MIWFILKNTVGRLLPPMPTQEEIDELIAEFSWETK
jgi:hypothetical protein